MSILKLPQLRRQLCTCIQESPHLGLQPIIFFALGQVIMRLHFGVPILDTVQM
jgi:hypothetical protein